MSNTHPLRGLQLQSLIRPEGELELALVQVDTPEPGPNEIVLRIEAAPINPSDIGLLFGAADLATAKGVLIDGHPALRVAVPERGMRAMAPRVGMANETLPVVPGECLQRPYPWASPGSMPIRVAGF